jgi:sugar O-acyltransferase (sialic acid O-acetyltransferase NeuD family)
MSRLIIVGAGDFGRELFGWIELDSNMNKFENILFIDDNDEVLNPYPYFKQNYLGTLENFEKKHDDIYLLGVSDPSSKLQIINLLKKHNITLSTYISEFALVSKNTIIGPGTIICPFVTVSIGAKLGNYVTLNRNSSVAHDTRIGDFCSIMGFSEIMGWGVVDSLVYVGSHVSVLPKVKIQEGAKIGAGSVVIADVNSGTTVFGNPAKEIRRN